MEPQAAKHRAGEAVAAGAINSVLAEAGEHDERKDARQYAEYPQFQRCHEQQRINRNENADGKQEADEQFYGRAGVFERFALGLGAGPQEPPHVGEEPEAVNAKRDRLEDTAADHQPPIVAAIANEAEPDSRGWAQGHIWRRRRRRGVNTIDNCHASPPYDPSKANRAEDREDETTISAPKGRVFENRVP